MKKTTLTYALWSFFALPLLVAQQAKFQFGLNAAVRISDATYKNDNRPPSHEDSFNESFTWRLAPGFNLWGRLQASRRVSIQAGLGLDISGYRLKEFTLRSSTPTMPEPIEIGKAKGAIHYYDITVPLSLRWKTGQRFYLTAGVAPLINAGRKRTIIIHFNTGEQSKTTEKIPESSGLEFKDFNLRGDAGFGYYILTNSRLHVYAEPLFSYTFLPVYSDDSGGKMGQWYVGVNLGVEL